MKKNRGYEQLILNPGTDNLAKFEQLAAAAKDAGFTHVEIAGLSERSDYRGENKDSPWCEWNMNYPCIFKHATPPGLEAAFPADFVKRQMDFVKAKHAIVERLGLKAAYRGLEPHWLSERVYAEHPLWRGSRCDNSLRTAGMFFSPDTDNPEVRQAYRAGVKEIVSQCPLIDTFVFHTNDCGAGYPWTGKLYVNPNGPTGTINGDMGVRVAGFLKTIRQGAADAGVDARVFTSTYDWFTPEETHLVLRSLEPGIGVIGNAPGELAGECSLSYGGGWGDAVIDGFPTPGSVVNGVRNIKTSKARRFQCSAGEMDFFTAFKAAMELPPATCERKKVQNLTAIAAVLYAEDVADDVVDAWYAIEQAHVREGAVSAQYLYLASVMLRWIIRPLVPHQELLTEEERSYWEPYIYQSRASQPETYLEYLNLTGKPMYGTWDHGTTICCAFDNIDACQRTAADILEKAAGKTSSETAREKLRIDALRAKARACLALTIRHTLQMGTLVIEHRKEAPKTSSVSPEVPDLPQGAMGSHALWYMYRCMRWELDNVNELISLIEQSPVPLIKHTEDRKREGALIMGPDVLEGLKKKARIMLKYWRTAEDGYYRPTKGG